MNRGPVLEAVKAMLAIGVLLAVAIVVFALLRELVAAVLL